jgi:heat shock protein HtpX
VEGDETPIRLSFDLSQQGDDLPPDTVPRVQFQIVSKRRRNDVRRIQANAVYFAVFGVWAVWLALAGQSVYGALSAAILFEMAFAIWRISSLTGQVVIDAEVIERLNPILIDLCSKAKCTIPRVVLRDDGLRVAAVRNRKGQRDLLLSRPYVEAVTDPQLRGIVAHEVIHLVHRDLMFARARAVVAFAAGFTLGIVAFTASGGVIKDLPVFLAATLTGTMLVRALLSPLNRRCEVRADLEGAALSGDPTATAQALAIADAQSSETRERLRGRPPMRWILSPLLWPLPTHPRMTTRIARLQRLT